mmetsp:Transcript_89774/g.253166  ORF Transcript_89774/g.253166 Transcript_89774/m.253166 type:complete len:296 (-) Transcript_89774:201-1088(-)
MGLCDVLGIIVFNILMLSLLAPVWICAAVGLCCSSCTSKNSACRRCLASFVIRATCLAWRLLLCLCCWIRVHVEGLDEFRSQLGASGRPVVIALNHTSFLDTILAVSLTPLDRVGSVKMMVGNHILNMPFLGQIVRAMGHLSVPFKQSGATGSFEVDKELMAESLRDLERHANDGGIVAWYPEGTINKQDPRTVGMFRAGGFVIPVNLDSEIWCIASVGNQDCWPPKAAVGGRPAKIHIRIFELCESSHCCLDAVNRPNELSNAKARQVYLANHAHRKVQEAIDEMVETDSASDM